MPAFRLIPSVENLLGRAALTAAAEVHGRGRVTELTRLATGELRERLRQADAPSIASEQEAGAWLEARIEALLEADLSPSLRPVINATGVIIHTNLGRAPLAGDARRAVDTAAAGYVNLEYDVTAGRRGDRHLHAEHLLCRLTGADAALVVNNNAAATLVVLAALGTGREVIVSRGELVEIGGGFRVPEILAQSGAHLREVGTTNRTRLADYGAAISPRTALLLRVHPSNFRIEGFTERPSLGELAALAHQFDLPLVEDLGSGWLGNTETAPAVLRDEPTVRGSLLDGVDLVCFSGDKLLGGPQAGIVVGQRAPIDRVRGHPLMRALRADKMTYAALEATLALWARAPARQQVPVYRMLTMALDVLDRRASALAAALNAVGGISAEVLDGVSTIGGGSAPGSALATRLVVLRARQCSTSALEARLRLGHPAVVARIEHDRLVLDPRTILEDEDRVLPDAVAAATANVRRQQ
jgi:L-seryl-tRNA(Ser) seleniumtransferase